MVEKPPDRRRYAPGNRRPSPTADERIAAFATPRQGIVSRPELFALSISESAIQHRLRVGRLRRIHPGVYAVGHEALTSRARWRAAVLSVSPRAALSHRSAAGLWGILPERSAEPIDVTAERQRRSRSRVVIHRGRLPREEVTVVDEVPVTTPARTLLDLAAMLSQARLEKAVNEASFLRLVDHASLAWVLESYRRRRGRAKLRRILERGRLGLELTRSELEDRFLAFLDRRRIPRPEVNSVVGARGRRFEVDCLWRDARLVVELDGRAAHGTRAAFEGDRARDRILAAAGWQVIRITWLQLHDDADWVAADLRAALTRREGR